MTPIAIVVPESLTTQKMELEATLAGIAREEEALASQRKDIQIALQSITTALAILSGQTLPGTNPATTTGTTRKPMSDEARQRIAEGLRKSAQARAAAKAAQGAAPASQAAAPAPVDTPAEASSLDTPADTPPDVPLAVSALHEPAQPTAEAPVADGPRGSRAIRKAAKAR